jgi:EpsI family protein
MSRLSTFALVAILLLAAAGALASVPYEPGKAHAPALSSIPMTLQAWTGTDGIPSGALTADPGAAGHLARTYQKGSAVVWVALDYYVDQTESNRPVVLQLLYPGRGWSTLSERSLAIPLRDGRPKMLPANFVSMRTEHQRLATLYWYQIGAHATASDHWYRASLLYHRLVSRRADGALVRVTAPVPDRDGESVVDDLTQFVQAFQPALVRALQP